MKLGRCPTCHAHIHIEQIVQDEAMSQLVKMLSHMDGELSRPLASYLGLFRPEKRDLSNERALKLCLEVIELTGDTRALAAALSQTVEMIRSKGGWPLKNHNYLKRVIDGIDRAQNVPVVFGSTGVGKAVGKTEQAFIDLEAMKK